MKWLKRIMYTPKKIHKLYKIIFVPQQMSLEIVSYL